MGKSFRIKTTPGEDKNIILNIDQDFEQLEILSLKIRQEDVYDRSCADYGVVAGRVLTNGGFGIPNAKVSIFIPLRDVDSDNPLITSVYPYKTIYDRNEDGYKFNLLPYLPSYVGHVPTGTFPSRLDVLNNETVSYIYDNYYKFTVTTNESGDYLIYGVPVGTQIIVMNVDLSDIGPFSLTPQDLVRMGMATETELNGIQFNSSTNFEELPQIIVINKTIDVVPFWGQPETCQIGITRTDFDLTGESNVNIQPTAVFMGSVMSTSERAALQSNGVPKKETGELCKLVAGPGEILAITQTIFQDENGLPVLERAKLPNGGKLIDQSGVWMFELPMNYDYVFTNEFGEQVISDDPKVGVPTKGKYRFKIKWQQSKNLDEDFKVGYYLVPNIREKGWDNLTDPDPATIPSLDPTGYTTNQRWNEFQRSYAFDLNWTGYTAWPNYQAPTLSLNNPDLRSAINCEDTFYEFDYNKVYTVAGFVDNYKIEQANSSLLRRSVRVGNRERFLGIKRIDDDTCEDEANKYPVNDGVLRTPLSWIINNIFLSIFSIIGYILIFVYSIVAYLQDFLFVALFALITKWTITNVAQATKGLVAALIPSTGFGATISWGLVIYYGVSIITWVGIQIAASILFAKALKAKFPPIKLPMMTYPDCETCKCSDKDAETTEGGEQTVNPSPILVNFGVGTPYETYDLLDSKVKLQQSCLSFPVFFSSETDASCVDTLLVGQNVNVTRNRVPLQNFGVPMDCKSFPEPEGVPSKGDQNLMYTTSLPFGERLNLFSLKSNYYNDKGGWNQMSIRYNPTGNTAPNNFHLDNFLVLVLQSGGLDVFPAGTLLSFVDPALSNDPNVKKGPLNSGNTRSITGITNALSNVNITYADPNNRVGNLTKQYVLDPSLVSTERTYQFVADIEYFQVVTGFTITQYRNLTNPPDNAVPAPDLINGLPAVIFSSTLIIKHDLTDNKVCFCNSIGGNNRQVVDLRAEIRNIDLIDQTSVVVILQRGVDPYSPKYETEVGIGKILGNPNVQSTKIRTNLRLNIPIQNTTSPGSEMIVRHDLLTTNNDTNEGNQSLFYKSYIFEPSANVFSAFTTNLHRFYSALDSSFISQAPPGYLFPYTNNNVKDVRVNLANNFGKNNTFHLNSPFNIPLYTPQGLTRRNRNYGNQGDLFDSVVGGSFMYKFTKDRCTAYFDGNDIQGCNMANVRACCDRNDEFDNCYQTSRPPSPLTTILGTTFNFSRIYDSGMTLNFNTRLKNVMRTDRLPSSSTPIYFNTGFTITGITNNVTNTPLFAQNYSFSIYSYSGDDVLGFEGGVAQYNYNENSLVSGANQFYGTVLDTFTCENMVNLKCYSGDGLTIGVNAGCAETDQVENGCYVFVKEPGRGLFKPKTDNDLTRWVEYVIRFRFYYALCQGVFSNVFTNNWVNGNLFAFPFKIDTYYNSQNKVSRRVYPRDLIVLQETVNNFYYRSTPSRLSGNNYRFLGGPVKFSFDTSGGNTVYIKTPTTILNLGPKLQVLKNITLDSNFYGYNVDNLKETTYSDLSDMINFFSIIRLSNSNFQKGLLKNDVLRKLFSRPGNRIDADFAQSSAINSQLGVIPFNSDYYSSSPPNAEIIAAGADQQEIMMGIYFNSTNDHLQIRDYISPVHIIRYNPTSPNPFIYDKLPVKSQVVPHYSWEIKSSGKTIFGTQKNNWVTTSSSILQDTKYQELNRKSNLYPRGVDTTNDYNYRGYIFGYQNGPKNLNTLPPGGLQINGVYTILDYKVGDDFSNIADVQNGIMNVNGSVFIATGATPTNWSNGSILLYDGDYQENGTLTPFRALAGAPWYFYFGLKKGATALNKFSTKYIGEELI